MTNRKKQFCHKDTPFIISVYLELLLIFASIGVPDIPARIAGALSLMVPLYFLWHIFTAFRTAKDASVKELFDHCFYIKLCLIPFYIIFFIYGVIMALVPMGFVLLPLLILIDFFILVTSSSYGIAGLITEMREGNIHTGKMLFHIILHLIFCADIVDCFLYRRSLNK